jgi:hypothetical protein
VQEPTEQEKKQKKNNKSTGENGIPEEILKLQKVQRKKLIGLTKMTLIDREYKISRRKSVTKFWGKNRIQTRRSAMTMLFNTYM